jgi:hypothetical protein
MFHFIDRMIQHKKNHKTAVIDLIFVSFLYEVPRFLLCPFKSNSYRKTEKDCEYHNTDKLSTSELRVQSKSQPRETKQKTIIRRDKISS